MQQRNHKTDEPSMEDILASIRKIISEEPAGLKPASAPAPAADPAKPAPTAQPAAAVAPAVQKPAPMPTAAVELPKPKADKPAITAPAPMPAPGATASRLSDVMRELAPSAVPVSTTGPATTTLSFHDDLSDLVESEIVPPPVAPPARSAPPPARAAAESPVKPEPAAPKPSVAPAAAKPAAASPAVPAAAKPAPAKAPAASSKPDLGPVDLGAFIPSTAESIAVVPGRSPSLSFANDLKSSEPQPLEHAPRTIALGIPNLEKAVPIAATPAKAPAKPANPAPMPAAIPAAPAPAAKAAAVLDAVAVEEIDRVADPVTAAQTALGALAVGLASAAPSPLPVPAAEPVPVPVAAKPVAPKDTAPAAATPPSTALAVSEPAAGDGQLVRRSLDDTIVGMLRPMIRDWLDTNLPEMVEKALQQELQERKGGDR